MTDKPTLLIVSSSNTKPKSIIKLLTKSHEINEDETKLSQTWTLDTKYYTAEINVIGINETYKRTDEFNENVEALIVHMDSNKESGLDDLKVWLEIEKDCQPEVKLLLANYCTDDTRIARNTALEWCLKRGFELIELYPTTTTTVSENDDLIQEKIGIERVVEALEAHTWSNLVMKERTATRKVSEQKPKVKECEEEFLTTEALDDFTDLFSQLHMMKGSLQSMPFGQRKQCAEQMVTAFWRAIGGDEEEIADI